MAGSRSTTCGAEEKALAEFALMQADHGTSIEVAPGDIIVIRLPENPTTGYQWTVEQVDADTLALQRTTFSPAPEAGMGSGGGKTLIFKAQKPGTAQIQLKLWRAWAGDASIRDRYHVTVQVQNG
jgi:inhibitor of cysteine peptidase